MKNNLKFNAFDKQASADAYNEFQAREKKLAEAIPEYKEREAAMRQHLTTSDKVRWLAHRDICTLHESGLEKNSPFFSQSYSDWRRNRVRKLLQIVGEKWLKNKSILELGCALGHTGYYLRYNFGADVTFAEARSHYIDYIKETIKKNQPEDNINDENFLVLDQDTDWTIYKNGGSSLRKFDLILNWGVNYHLANWKRDIERTLAHSDKVCIETHVLDSEDLDAVAYRHEYGCDKGTHGIESVPSYSAVEKVFKDNKFSYERYDDSDLDGAGNHYSWVNENDSSAFIKVIDSKTKETHYFLKRRYWFAQRKKSIFCKAFELLKKQ